MGEAKLKLAQRAEELLSCAGVQTAMVPLVKTDFCFF